MTRNFKMANVVLRRIFVTRIFGSFVLKTKYLPVYKRCLWSISDRQSMRYKLKRNFYLDFCFRGKFVSCWKCNNNVNDDEFVCSKCECLQSPNPSLNHFKLLQIEEKFDLDILELMTKFKDLQKKFHPDKFGQKSKREQDYSAIYSAQINKAYQTLLKPFQRGLYILELKGKPLDETTITMNPEFLMEIMETNEILADKSTRVEKIREIAAKNCAKIDELMSKLSKELKNENWDSAHAILAKMKYFANIDEKVKLIMNDHQLSEK